MGDPKRPFPGVHRDVSAAAAGHAQMSQGRRTLELGSDASHWPSAARDRDVVFGPIGWITSNADTTHAVQQLAEFVRPGGLLVTEEPAFPPTGFVAEEPLTVERDVVELVRVEATDDRYVFTLTTYKTGHQESHSRDCVVPGERAIDEVLDRMRWVCVGRWRDWAGTSALGSPWHVAVHRAPTGA